MNLITGAEHTVIEEMVDLALNYAYKDHKTQPYVYIQILNRFKSKGERQPLKLLK